MTDFDPESYAAGWRQDNRRQQRHLAARVASAREEAQRLAAELVERATVREVILFGSLAEGTTRSLNFDIDLAIKGGDQNRALRIGLESHFAVDIVDYDSASPHLRQRIDRQGVLLKRHPKES